jgi:16S rRNA (uracil1498-N3)-methyltransferase
MRISRFYLPTTFNTDNCVELTKEQAHYALNVLRLKHEHPVELFDGKGTIAQATLIVTSRRTAKVEIKSIAHALNESPLHSVLVQGISKGDRMDYSIQKAVELGVTAIQPVFTDRVDVKLPENKLEKRRAQWQSIAINACEQSGRAWVPEVYPLKTLKEFLQASVPLQGIVCDPYAQQSLANLGSMASSKPMHFLVGPEGGLTQDEVSFAQTHGFTAIQLGPRILRTETAGPTMLAIAQSIWGDI